MAEDNKEVIDLREVFKKVCSRKKLFLRVWVITFLLSCLYILPIPRSYQSEVTLVPETSSQLQGGSLSALASSFGFNIGNMESEDAFYPEIYPDVIASNEFIVNLFDVKVETQDGEISTNYLDYLVNHQKTTFYKVPFIWAKKQVKALFPKKKPKGGAGSDGKVDPKCLGEDYEILVEMIRSIIICNVDKKTGVISISVTDQDPLVCASMADSVRVRLQEFITNYRTSKARIDAEYYAELSNEAYSEYQDAVTKYGEYSDSHQDMFLQTAAGKRDELENDMQTKLTTYNAMNTQYQAAKAKVQERTPAFTILQGASVPSKPNGPKRMLFVIAMLFLSSFGTICYIFKKDILDQFTHVQ